MHNLAHSGSHQFCPKEWRKVPVVSNDYDLDATIMHRSNRDLPHRLELYTRRGAKSYGPRTSYNGYEGYHGDD